jgi:prephenate dehydratase
MTIAYLGPRGSITEEALVATVKIPEKDLVACRTIEEVFRTVEADKADQGIVPIENSIEGSVNATLDMLAFESDLVIEREIVWPVRHQLITAPSVSDLSEVTTVISHPQAIGQCRRWLEKHLPGVPQQAANSTAEAVQRAVAEPGLAAIGSKLAAKIYDGRIQPEEIEDNQENQTRFVIVGTDVVGRDPEQPDAPFKTSIACFIFEDRPGMLLQILSEFSFRQINLTKIQSRPTKKQLGSYYFFIDLEGHQEDREVADALRFLGMRLAGHQVRQRQPGRRQKGNGRPGLRVRFRPIRSS